MPVAWQQLYADRAQGMRASDIREILKITAQPDVISLAGGLPAPELFPIDEYRRAFEWVLESDGAQALQYGPSEGYRPLRKLLAERLSRFGIGCSADDILVTNGSQQALDLMMKEGFQQEGEAVAKWKRARLSSTQLSTYFIGVTEHLELRERAKAKAGAKFDLRKYNDTVLSFGSPPAKYVRELMGL